MQKVVDYLAKSVKWAFFARKHHTQRGFFRLARHCNIDFFFVVLVFFLYAWCRAFADALLPGRCFRSGISSSGQISMPSSPSSNTTFLVLTHHLQHSPFHLSRPYTPSSPFSTLSSIAGHPVRSSLFVMHVSAASLCDGDAISATRGRMMPPVYTAHHGPQALLSGLP